MKDTLDTLIRVTLDSLPKQIVNSVDSFHLSIQNLNKGNDSIDVSNIISAVIGGLLVISGQYVMERFKKKNAKKTELINTIGVIVLNRGNIKNNLRELAMFKTHASYWEYFSKLSNDFSDKVDQHQNHLKSQVDFRNAERDIGVSIASFLAQVTRFEIILGNQILTNEDLKNIDSIDFRKAKKYNTDQSYDEVRGRLVEKDEEDLRNEYYSNLLQFDRIITKLRQQIK